MLTLIIRRMDAGNPLHLVVSEPGCVVSRRIGSFRDWSRRLGRDDRDGCFSRCFGDDDAVKFTKLGKPYAPMFDSIKERLNGYERVAFVGDQLHTDIAGANRAGMDSVLIGTGITRWESADGLQDVPEDLMPTLLLHSMTD